MSSSVLNPVTDDGKPRARSTFIKSRAISPFTRSRAGFSGTRDRKTAAVLRFDVLKNYPRSVFWPTPRPRAAKKVSILHIHTDSGNHCLSSFHRIEPIRS